VFCFFWSFSPRGWWWDLPPLLSLLTSPSYSSLTKRPVRTFDLVLGKFKDWRVQGVVSFSWRSFFPHSSFFWDPSVLSWYPNGLITYISPAASPRERPWSRPPPICSPPHPLAPRSRMNYPAPSSLFLSPSSITSFSDFRIACVNPSAFSPPNNPRVHSSYRI